MRRFFRSAAFPILIVIVLAFFAQRLISPGEEEESTTYSEFIAQVEDDTQAAGIESVTLKQKTETVDVKKTDGTEFSTGYPSEAEAQLVNTLERQNVQFDVEGTGGSGILSLLTYVLPFVLFLGFWLFLMNQMQGGGSRVMSFGKSRAKRMSVDAPKITFRDVAGADEAVQELHEIKEFLENPKKFQSLGARIPKGVLLYGPPGTGKTLLAPGRFDRQIVVDRPDRKGRKQILEVHTRGKPLSTKIDLDVLAGQTPGFTGADLANLINEAALLTARSNKREITMSELEEGIMRVIAGPEKKTRVMSEKERTVTAYHELGHAIVGHLLPNSDPVHKVSIISRGQALGYTISLPTEDKFLTTRAELTDTMAMTLGGRAAEELIFDEITTGASNDLEKVTETAKQMVMRFGMSERLGPRVFGHDHGQPFLGREFSSEPDYSDEIAREIDDEIRRIVEDAHQTAKDILGENQGQLDRISQILLERETIEAEEFVALLDGKPEEEVFPPDADETVEPPEEEAEAEKKSAREGPRPRVQPKPGLAGGGAAEMHGDES